MPIGPGSFIAVTPGSGAKLATGPTYTENSNVVQDEKVIPGEPYLATYIVAFASSITLANASTTQLIQLMAGASLKVYVRRITLYQSGVGALALFLMDILRVSTAPTGGTAVTPNALDPADALSGATAAYLPTVAGTTGSRISVGQMNVQTAVPTSGTGVKMEWTWYPDEGQKSLVIPAGTANGIVIRNTTGSTAASIIGEIEFQEAAF